MSFDGKPPTVVNPDLFWKEAYLRSFCLGVLTSWMFLVAIHVAGVTKIAIVQQFIDDSVIPLRKFFWNSVRLFKRCTKPTRKEFSKIATATAIGFSLMGFLGFFVKLVHIPINNIIVS